jgi:uncharacterized protein (TIGR02270 family)
MNLTVVGLADVIFQHAEGGSFLWQLRRRATDAPHYALDDLTKLDLRVEAHLDGLRIAGDRGWDLCREALALGESGEVFAAAVLAFESNQKHRVEKVIQAGAASPELTRGLISALGWLEFAQAEQHIRELVASASTATQTLGVAAYAIHRQNPGPPLMDALSMSDPLLRARALKAVGELGLDTLKDYPRDHLAEEVDQCRFCAAWSLGLLSSDPSALATLQLIAESDKPYAEEGLQVCVRRMDASTAGAWRDKLSQNTNLLRKAILMSGVFGDPAIVPWLLEQMKMPKLARVAGEAFTMITGVDIAFEDLDSTKPEGFESGPSEDPNDENVEMDPDEHLPWPDPNLIEKWWAEHNGNFQRGTRYLLGNPISVVWCEHVLRAGRQRQRAAAALEIAIRQPGRALFNVAAPGFRQQHTLNGSA